MTSLTITRKIELKMTAQEWQLYCSMDGIDAIADQINRGVEEAVNSSSNTKEALAKIFEVLAKYSKFGAYDTEPCGVAEYLVEKIYGETY